MTTHSNQDKLDHICRDLDELTLSYLSKVEQYTQQRATTSSDLQKGFLDLAHAKYTMGAKTISHFSYDERMKAQIQLDVDQQASHSYSARRFTARTIENTPAKKSTGLRQRNENKSEWIQKEGEEDVTEKEEYEMDEKKPTKKGKKVPKANDNPLHWFGLLVSPSLRSSQDHFQSALHHLIDMANNIRELEYMENQYQRLKQEKSEVASLIKLPTSISTSSTTPTAAAPTIPVD